MANQTSVQITTDLVLQEKVIRILTATGKRYSVTELSVILSDYEETQIEANLDLLIKRNGLIHRTKSQDPKTYQPMGLYHFTLSTEIEKFIQKIITETAEILKQFPYKTREEREEILGNHGFTIPQLLGFYNGIQTQPIQTKTLRNYLVALKEIHYLHSGMANTYSLDLDYLEQNRNMDAVVELSAFWNQVHNFEQIVAIKFHDLVFQHPEKLQTNYASLTQQNGWRDQGNFKEKLIPISTGKITLEVYSNQANQQEHTIIIRYKGELTDLNADKRKETGKFAFLNTQFPTFIGEVHFCLYTLRMKHEIGFHEKEFESFLLKQIGIAVDYEHDGLRNRLQSSDFPLITFAKEMNFRDWNKDYSLRFYTYQDKFSKKQIDRVIDAHVGSNPYTVKGVLSAFSQTGSSMIDAQITHEILLTKQKEMESGLKSLRKNDLSLMSYMATHSLETIHFLKEQRGLILEGSSQIQKRILETQDSLDLMRLHQEKFMKASTQLTAQNSAKCDEIFKTENRIQAHLTKELPKILLEINANQVKLHQLGTISDSIETLDQKVEQKSQVLMESIEEIGSNTTEQTQSLAQAFEELNRNLDHTSQTHDEELGRLSDNIVLTTDLIHQLSTNYDEYQKAERKRFDTTTKLITEIEKHEQENKVQFIGLMQELREEQQQNLLASQTHIKRLESLTLGLVTKLQENQRAMALDLKLESQFRGDKTDQILGKLESNQAQIVEVLNRLTAPLPPKPTMKERMQFWKR
jgi:hypothetical protein